MGWRWAGPFIVDPFKAIKLLFSTNSKLYHWDIDIIFTHLSVLSHLFLKPNIKWSELAQAAPHICWPLPTPLTDCSSEPVEPHTKTFPGVEGLLAIQHSWPGKPKLAQGEIGGVKSTEKPGPIVLPICNFKAHSWQRKYVCPLCSVRTCSLIINPQRIKGKD